MPLRITACLRLMRLVNSVMVGFAVIVGVALATQDIRSVDPMVLIAGFTVGLTVAASSMVLNDIIDIEIDAINAPDRPLPSGQISVRAAWACYAVLVAAGLASSIVGGLDSLLLAALGVAVAAVYNARLKLSGFPGNVAVAFSTSLPFLYAFTLVDNANPVVIIFWAMVFLTVLGREIAKDIADVEGDMVKNARTLPILYGRKNAALLATLFYMVAVVLSPAPALWGLVRNPRIYMAGVTLVDVLLVYSSIALVLNPRKQVALHHKRVVLVAMLIGLVTFLLSQTA